MVRCDLQETKETIEFIRELFRSDNFIPLHEPCFSGNEKQYLNECIDSTFVSSVGKFVDQFEEEVVKYTKVKHAVATVNGTAALHIALILAGVKENEEVITQPLTFVATCNAISYINALPVFVDVDLDTMGLSPEKLEHFLTNNTTMANGDCYNIKTKRRISAVLPMHTFGMPVRLNELAQVCSKFNIAMIEDAAEALGSLYKGQHTGNRGLFGTLSFNGNKTITTGGGGMILTNDSELANKAKHITTTAKIPHKWDFNHNMVAYNYRLPNLNAALGCAQMENLDEIILRKRTLAKKYQSFFQDKGIEFINEPKETVANYWLIAVRLKNKEERDKFLKETNDQGVMTRPIWKLMNELPMFSNSQATDLENSIWLSERVVNIPSSVKV